MAKVEHFLHTHRNTILGITYQYIVHLQSTMFPLNFTWREIKTFSSFQLESVCICTFLRYGSETERNNVQKYTVLNNSWDKDCIFLVHSNWIRIISHTILDQIIYNCGYWKASRSQGRTSQIQISAVRCAKLLVRRICHKTMCANKHMWEPSDKLLSSQGQKCQISFISKSVSHT